ncbi:NAD(P)/FAD-dependent oxidoreductase [Endozoicomonas numazuensis]|uniref:NAD(P)/FAD-dependent oxidoreductase n=1 Tax=Endozoicomonas numazuensis TaxID=1137799 RepID=UPI000555F44C|nr:NAD(P)/FAD-dependent oxidoreductase [Endozoicomonas numazuensis]
MNSSKRILIIGGGISGLSAALWCQRQGLQPLIIEQTPRLGGQLHQIHLPLVDYPGFKGTASELLETLVAQISEQDIHYRLGQSIKHIDYKNNVAYTENESLTYSALIMATGNRKRALPQLKPFMGRHVHMTATGVIEQLKHQHIAIIGGGDGAFENALLLAPSVNKVDILIRSGQPRARQYFVEQARRISNISLHYQQKVQYFKDEPTFRGLHLAHSITGEEQRLECDQVIIKCGYTPAQELLPESLLPPENGLQLDDQNIWVIGDVRNPIDPCMSVCIGEAARASREISRYLEPIG